MMQVDHLSKTYGSKQAIRDLSFSVAPGEAFGLVGPNGAGKSTTIRCLMGFVRATSGLVTIANKDCWRQVREVHRMVGYLPGEVILPENVTGVQFLSDVLALRGVSDRTNLNRLISHFDLNPKTLIRLMSKGTRQKLAIIATLVHDPSVLILDEPTSGLDPVMQQAFMDVIAEEHERGKTIILSSHIFTEIERICDRVAMLKEGQLIASDEISKLRAEQESLFEVTFSTLPDLAAFHGFRIVSQQGFVVTIAVQDNWVGLFKTLASMPVVHVRQRTLTLESVFRHYYYEDEATV